MAAMVAMAGMARGGARVGLARVALFAAALSPTAADAGITQLASRWMSHAPEIDGTSTASDWRGAFVGVLPGGPAVAFGNDARTLYFGVFDSGNPVLGAGDFVTLRFDDEGGTPPSHEDGAWAN